MLDVFNNYQKLRHVQVILKIPYLYVFIELQSNRPKRPQSAANDVERVVYRRIHHVWILTSHDSIRVTTILHDALLSTEFFRPLFYNSRAHCLHLIKNYFVLKYNSNNYYKTVQFIINAKFIFARDHVS